MKCPYCDKEEAVRVKNTYSTPLGKRRRYICGYCQRSYYTRVFEFYEYTMSVTALEELNRQEAMSWEDGKWGKEELAQLDDAGQVYLLKSENGYYKIGRSKDALKRFRAICNSAPFKIELLHVINTPNDVRLEAKLHEFFSGKRTVGEWFLLSDDDVLYIMTYRGDEP